MSKEASWTLRESFERLQVVRQKQSYSANTLRGIRTEGNAMIKFFGEDFPIREIAPDRMMEYLAARAEKLRAASMNKTLDRLIEWIGFCERAGAGPTRELIDGWRRAPEPPVEDRTFVPIEEIPNVLAHAGRRDPRDRFLLAVLWYTGLRPNEIARLTIGSVDEKHAMIHAIRSKVNDVKDIPVEAGMTAELDMWLPYYYKHALSSTLPREKWALVPSRGVNTGSGGGFAWPYLRPEYPLIRIRHVVRDVLTRAGFEGRRLGASTLRHSAGSQLHDSLMAEGAPDALRRTQIFLGHAREATTERYLDKSRQLTVAKDTAARGILTPAASTPTRVALSNVFNILTGEPVTA